MKRNVGVYNLRMPAMGGGEKLTLVLAKHLRLTNNVSLFCAEPLDKAKLEDFFGVDLSGSRSIRSLVLDPCRNSSAGSGATARRAWYTTSEALARGQHSSDRVEVTAVNQCLVTPMRLVATFRVEA